MRWVACLLFAGCGLTLDLTPPEEDGGVFDASRRDAGRDDAAMDDGSVDANVDDVPTRDVMIDAVFRPDSEVECTGDPDCFEFDCVRRGCRGGVCVDLGAIVCDPLVDPCHEYTGLCTDDRCDQALIDFDGDGQAPIELGTCGTDCDDDNPAEAEGIACGEDLDDDGYGSKDVFFALCGSDIACPEGYVEDLSDCWDDFREGSDPGPQDANPDASDRFFSVPQGDGTFDWNCDAMITSSLPRRAFGVCDGMDVPSGRCQMQTGWRGPVPSCGEQQLFTFCESVGGRCAELPTVLRTQTCR